MHKRFGAGVITNITPENDDLMLEIMFENSGMKRLMAKFAQLEVYGNQLGGIYYFNGKRAYTN